MRCGKDQKNIKIENAVKLCLKSYVPIHEDSICINPVHKNLFKIILYYSHIFECKNEHNIFECCNERSWSKFTLG